MENADANPLLQAMKALSEDVASRMEGMSKRFVDLEKKVAGIESSSGGTEISCQDSSHDEAESSELLSWADRPEDETMDFDKPLDWGDEDVVSGGKVFDVSEGTKKLLVESFTRSVNNTTRRKQKERHGVPRVAATRVPTMDKAFRDRLSNSTVRSDKELTRLHSLVLDAVGPITYLLEKASTGNLSPSDVVETSKSALHFLGNASVRLSQHRRKLALKELNPKLTDLSEEDSIYAEASPKLFGDKFYKEAKEREEQLKSLDKSTRSSGKYSDSRSGSTSGYRSNQSSRRGGGGYGRYRGGAGGGRYQPYQSTRSVFWKNNSSNSSSNTSAKK